MTKKLKILIVEDNKADYVLLKKALEKLENITMDLTCLTNGEESIKYILKEEKHKDVETPDIIILDINLPIKNGFEVLETLKTNETYKYIPIIIYSTSEENDDIHKSYSLYANSYITKTPDIQELFKKINLFGKYWTETTKLSKKKERT